MTELRLPDFIIGGAPRSATTWLWQLLNRHPDAYMAEPVAPEPKFFLIDELYDQGIEYYSRTWFASAPSGKVIGEKSTNYLESPAAAQRIFTHLPDVKLVFIFRNPVDRAFSNYLWTTMNGLETESFERALEMEESRAQATPERLKYARPYAYASRGFYHRMLLPYFDLFPRQNILCLRTEDIYHPKTRVQLAEKLCRFLGLELRAPEGHDEKIVNASVDSKAEQMTPSVRVYLDELYRAENERFLRLVGADFGTWQEN
jgi:hypothetical protein